MRYGPRTVVLSLLLAAAAPAQFSGAYTIDPNMAAGGTNYVDFASAVADLLAMGVGGATTFDVADGMYVGFGIATPIPGASTTNTVEFKAANTGLATITGPAGANLQAIRLGTVATAGSGPAHVIVRGFVVQGAATGAGIIASGGSNISILECTVQNCGAGIVYVTVNGGLVEGCTVQNCANTPGTPGSTTYCGGIAGYLNTDSMVIRRNRVINCASNGIFVGTSGDTTACDSPQIVNNMVSGCPGISTYPGGIVVRRTPNAVVVNNSVRMPVGTLFHGIHMQQLSSTTIAHMQPLDVSNNVVRHDGLGACIAMNTNNIAGPAAPDAFDYNLYQTTGGGFIAAIGTGTSATSGYVFFNSLVSWTGLAVPNMAGKEANTAVGSPAYATDDDLHITCTSAALFNGTPSAYAPVDLDGDVRDPINPCRGADEIAPNSAYVDFSASVNAGGAPHSVTFTDFSCSLAGPISAWAWDFENDGLTDSTLQNPSHIYVAPGVYAVKLTVTDPAQMTSRVKTGFITVGPYLLDVQTAGGGAGDLTVIGIPNVGAPGTIQGYLFLSFLTTASPGAGPFFGIHPDFTTFSILLEPAVVGGVLHFVSLPGFFPNAPFVLPTGALAALAGFTIDFVQVDLNAFFGLASVSNVDRVTI